MPKLTVTHHDFLPNHQRRRFAEMMNDSEQPFDVALDYFVCGAQERPMQDSEATQEQLPLDEHPQGVKRSRQRVAAKSNMLHLFDPS